MLLLISDNAFVENMIYSIIGFLLGVAITNIYYMRHHHHAMKQLQHKADRNVQTMNAVKEEVDKLKSEDIDELINRRIVYRETKAKETIVEDNT